MATTADGIEYVSHFPSNSAQAVRTTTGHVSRKRKASGEGEESRRKFHCASKCLNGPAVCDTLVKNHGKNDVDQDVESAEERFEKDLEEDALDGAHSTILKEEEDIRVQSGLQLDPNIDSDMEREYADAEFIRECEELPNDYSEEDNAEDVWRSMTHTSVLEEEETVRVEAALISGYPAGTEVEQDFDENGDMFDELDDIDMEEEDILLDHDNPNEHRFRVGVRMVYSTKDDEFFSARIDSSTEEMYDSGYQKELCNNCRLVRWSQLASVSLGESHPVLKVHGSPLQLQGSSCLICKFLGSMVESKICEIDTRDGMLTIELKISPSLRKSPSILIATLKGESDQSISTMITLHALNHEKEWTPRLIAMGTVHYDALRRMYEQCRCYHKVLCGVKSRGHRLGLRVIDCSTRELVSAPADCKYVALSYVWGPSAQQPTSDLYNTRFPLTIQDSVRVTKRMGFRYLWVDRYVWHFSQKEGYVGANCAQCIDQEDKAEKHAIIQSMDEIYAKAQLTIVAAAGNDPDYGLPGVSTRARCRERSVRVGNTKLVQLMRPGSDFPKSSWWKRAWTYQEGVLSKRKLVFTDHQVYYICNAMHAAESIYMHHDPTDTHKTASSFTDSASFSEMMWPSGSRSSASYLSDISRRALSHSSDALNTCLGILKATNTTHIWGIPIEIKPCAWAHKIALHWRHDLSATRRHGFPSWSWTGWEGGVEMQEDNAEVQYGTMLLGNDHKTWETVHQYITSGRARSLAGRSSAPHLLKVTGLAIDAALLRHQWPDITDFGYGAGAGSRPRFTLKFHGASALCVLYMDEKMNGTEQMHDVIALGFQKGNSKCCVSALLLKPRGDGVYVRVGLMQMSCEYPTYSWCARGHVFWSRAARERTAVIE